MSREVKPVKTEVERREGPFQPQDMGTDHQVVGNSPGYQEEEEEDDDDDDEVHPVSSPRISPSNRTAGRKRGRRHRCQPVPGWRVFIPPLLQREDASVAPMTRRNAFALPSTGNPGANAQTLVDLYHDSPDGVADSLRDMQLPAEMPCPVAERMVQPFSVAKNELSTGGVVEDSHVMLGENHQVGASVVATPNRGPTFVLTPAEVGEEGREAPDVGDHRLLRTGSWHEDLGIETMPRVPPHGHGQVGQQ